MGAGKKHAQKFIINYVSLKWQKWRVWQLERIKFNNNSIMKKINFIGLTRWVKQENRRGSRSS